MNTSGRGGGIGGVLNVRSAASCFFLVEYTSQRDKGFVLDP